MKYIKAKTQLHQTIVDKCLKTLTQKQLVKTVTDIRVRMMPCHRELRLSALLSILRALKPTC